MNELVLANRAEEWRKLKMLVLDSVSSPITVGKHCSGLIGVADWKIASRMGDDAGVEQL